MDQLMSISKIFSEKIFRIPDYQRGYAWTIKEVEDFWGDLCRLEDKKNHYVGVLTLEPAKPEEYEKWVDDLWIIDAKQYVPYYVVDGQQRLTTSIIFIYTILEIMQERGIPKLNYTKQEEISRKYIYEYKEENKNRTYIYGYENDNPSYEYLITQIYNEKIVSFSSENETIYTNNLDNAKRFFREKLINMSVKELESVYTKITQHFLFNMYTISEDIDVFVTFETMNNRGKPLSNLELLKNRLIYVSTLFKVDEHEKVRLRRDINQCWKKIYHILGKNRERKLLDDEFLVTHFMLYFAKKEHRLKNQTRKEYYDFGEWQSNYLLNHYFVVQRITDNSLTLKDCFNYIESLCECIDFWGTIKNPYSSNYGSETKEYIDRINYFSNGRTRYYIIGHYEDYLYLNVFLLACFKASKKNENILLKLLKALEKYLFAIDFFDREALDDADIKGIQMSEMVVKLNMGDMDINNVIEKIEKVYTSIITNSEVGKRTIAYYSKNGFYSTSWLHYFLFEYEYSLMKKSKSNIEKLNRWQFYEKRYDSIEHIYPDNSHYQYWINMFAEYDSKKRNILKNSLGNFVAISRQKNSKLGNKPFPEKKSNKENPVGYKYGTYAEIELTEYDDWDAQAILKRGLKLVDFLFERWGIKIGKGTKEEKQKFLGLFFL